MNPEIYRQPEPGTPKYPPIQGTPAEDGWVRFGNTYVKETPGGGTIRLSKEEWEKKQKSIPHREMVAKGLEMKQREDARQAAIKSLYDDLMKTGHAKKDLDGKETTH